MTTEQLVSAGVARRKLIYDPAAKPAEFTTSLVRLMSDYARRHMNSRLSRLLVPDGATLQMCLTDGWTGCDLVGATLFGIAIEAIPKDAKRLYLGSGMQCPFADDDYDLVIGLTKDGGVIFGSY